MKRILLAAFVSCFVFLAKAQNYQLNQGYSFIENKGQILDEEGKPASDILFTSRIGNAKIFLAKTGVHYLWEKRNNFPTADVKTEADLFIEQLEKSTVESYRLDIELVGANPNPAVQTLEPSDDFINYYLSNRKEGILGVKHFAKVVYKDVYPGIDWVWYNKEGGIKYDFVVNPGADYKQIKLKVSGADAIKLLEEGGLKIETPLGTINENEPISFISGKKTIAYFKLEENIISFNVPEATGDDKLVIDPVVLVWSTYYGGSGDEQSLAMATGVTTNDVYIAGFTTSTTNIYFGGHQDVSPGYNGPFLAKFDKNGNRLWATYYGGTSTGGGVAYGVGVDSAENVFMGGYIGAADSVAYNGHNNTFSGGSFDAFVVKFDKNGVRKWGTYHGGTGLDMAFCLTVSKKGGVWIGGKTTSTAGISLSSQTSYKGNTDGFFAYYDSTGTFIQGEYFGGANFDEVLAITADAQGDKVLFSGDTKSTTGISKSGFQSGLGGDRDAFIAKYGSALEWATYYGGIGAEYAYGISVDNSDNVYVSGETGSTTKIASTGSYQTTLKGSSDAFLVKFSSTGSRVWGTYFGGELIETSRQNAINGFGEILITGQTNSTTGIANNNGYQNTLSGGFDGYLAKFDNAGALLWSTYFGDSLGDFPQAAAFDKNKAIYITGITLSLKNIAQGGYQNTSNGGYEGFLTKFVDLYTPNQLPDYTTCGKLKVTYIAKKPSSLYTTRWYGSETDTTWFYEGDTLTQTYTQTDSVWVAFTSGPYSGPRVRAIVTILPSPDALFTVNDSVQCTYTNSFIFTNTTDTKGLNVTYQWNFDDGVISSKFNDTHKYLNIGVYKVKLDATNTANGCKTRFEKTIQVLKLPIQQITGPTVSQQNATENYSAKASAGSTYTWTITGGTQISGGTTENISVTWASSVTKGKVEVVENDTNGCHSDAVIADVILTVDGINDVAGNFVSVYPNPATKTMYIETAFSGSYIITDITGRQLLQAEIEKTSPQIIDISGLSPGTYLFNYTTNQGMAYITKLVVY